MTGDFLGDRRRALEESFFARQDRDLLEQLRQQLGTTDAKAALAQASGIKNDAVLAQLLAANVRAESLAALSLVPLVAVAWADGQIDAQERTAVLDAAGKHGIAAGTVAHQLLAGWLQAAPQAGLVAAWKEYVHGLQQSLDSETVATLRHEVLERASLVAQAAGGLLGVGTISATEKRVLTELEQAFDRPT